MEKLTVFTARRVRTMDAGRPLAEAVAVADGKIVSVGTLKSMRPWLDKFETEIAETFKDKVIFPGFIDPHTHFRMSGVFMGLTYIGPIDQQGPRGFNQGIATREGVLDKLPVLVAFLPVILGMAGNVGTQTSALTVRALALGRFESERYWRIIYRQFLTGVGLGIMFGAVLFTFVIWRHPSSYAALLGLSLFTAMTVGTTMGVAVPLSLHRLGFDPAIATSPSIVGWSWSGWSKRVVEPDGHDHAPM